MDKLITPLVCDCVQVVQIPRIREFVQIYEGSRIPFDPLQDEIGSDKTCSTSDQDRVFHIVEVAQGCNNKGPFATLRPRERMSIVNKKDGIHPVLLLVHSILSDLKRIVHLHAV
jgi:hypothetical protein